MACSGEFLNQTVIVVAKPSDAGDKEIVGTCFTPQDGNSLLSSIAASSVVHVSGFLRRATRAGAAVFFQRDLNSKIQIHQRNGSDGSGFRSLFIVTVDRDKTVELD